jgi:exonuclease III
VKKVPEIHLFCVYISQSPKDGEKRRYKVLKHLVKWTAELKAQDIPFFIVGDLNTNLDRLKSQSLKK